MKSIVNPAAGLSKVKPDIKKMNIRPYLFILPAMVFLLIFVLYPIFDLIHLSFVKWNMVEPEKTWMGLRNYKTLFNNGEFLQALWNTTVYTFFTVILSLGLSILVALWLRKVSKLNTFTQGVIFLPHVVSLVSIAMVWMWLMDTDVGLINNVLKMVGLPTSRWFRGSESAMMSIILVSVWKGVGYYSLIVLSALQNIPSEIYEAAELDNSNKYRTFFKIIFPMISPITFFLLITMTISSYKVFETVRIMTAGGPGSSTMVLVYYIYENAFKFFKFGYASAAGVVLLAIVTIVTALYFRLLSKRIHYQ